MLDHFSRLFTELQDEAGQTMAEYAVVLAAITIAVVAVLALLATAITGKLKRGHLLTLEGCPTGATRVSPGSCHRRWPALVSIKPNRPVINPGGSRGRDQIQRALAGWILGSPRPFTPPAFAARVGLFHHLSDSDVEIGVIDLFVVGDRSVERRDVSLDLKENVESTPRPANRESAVIGTGRLGIMRVAEAIEPASTEGEEHHHEGTCGSTMVPSRKKPLQVDTKAGTLMVSRFFGV